MASMHELDLRVGGQGGGAERGRGLGPVWLGSGGRRAVR